MIQILNFLLKVILTPFVIFVYALYGAFYGITESIKLGLSDWWSKDNISESIDSTNELHELL